MIAPVGMTSGTIPPVLHHAGLLPIDADDVPELGDIYTAVEGLGEVSPMDALYVGRPLYQPAGFNPFDNGDVPGRVLVADPDLRRRGRVRRGARAGRRSSSLMWDLDVDPTDFTRDPWLDD